MSLANRIAPYLTSAVSSQRTLELQRAWQEIKRKRRGQTHEVLLFHKVDDPYSHLLLQMLQRLRGDFDIKVKPQIIHTLDERMFPEPGLLEEWSLRDASQLAKAFNLDFPTVKKLPDPELCARAEKILLSNEKSDSFVSFAIDVNNALWNKGESSIEALEQEVGRVSDEQRLHLLAKSEHILKKKGHYLGGTLFYGGEWYWGVDRILHLAQRLKSLGIAKTSVDIDQYDHPKNDLSSISSSAPLDFYFSFRSPYSYLACQRIKKLKDTHDIDLNIKPVLPMVMRGLPVPSTKRLYIFLDTKRECERHGIPFGKTVDPLGEGVNRCMSIYPYAKSQGKELDYIASVSRGIWAEGQDVTQDSALQALCERAQLNWDDARLYLQKSEWQTMAESNRSDMINLGFWGVPSFQYKNKSFWGQDRLWAIEQCLVENSQGAKKTD